MERLGLEIKRLNNLISRNISNLETISLLNEISNSNGFILRYIEEHEDEVITQKDIEKAFGITRSTASTVLSLMEKKELIVREVLKEDNRVKKVLITDKGKKINSDIKKEIDQFELNLIKGFNDEELKQFLFYIDKLKENLKEEK